MLNPTTRSSLIARLCNISDQDAWHEFAELYQPFIYRQGRRFGLQPADAHELVQEVLIAISKAVGKFEVSKERGRFRTWLYAVGRNICLTHLSKLRSQELTGCHSQVFANQVDSNSSHQAEGELSLELQRHIFVTMAHQIRDEFQVNTWSAFWQTAVENCATQMVAKELNMSVGAIYVARSRVMARLKQRVQEISLDDAEAVQSLLQRLEST